MSERVTSVLFAGIGGQGIILASDILAEVAFVTGCDVKKSEVHGMSQRGGSVTSHVRFGKRVYSPLIPEGEVDFLVALHEAEEKRWKSVLRNGGRVVSCDRKILSRLPNLRTMNIALLGTLSNYLAFDASSWRRVISRNVPKGTEKVNLTSFSIGRASGEEESSDDMEREV